MTCTIKYPKGPFAHTRFKLEWWWVGMTIKYGWLSTLEYFVTYRIWYTLIWRKDHKLVRKNRWTRSEKIVGTWA